MYNEHFEPLPTCNRLNTSQADAKQALFFQKTQGFTERIS